MTLDENDPDDVLVVARDQHRVIPDKHPNRGLVGDLTQFHGFHHDRVPAVVTDPLRLPPAFGRVRVPIQDSDDAVVTKNALNFAVCHVVS